MIIAIYNFANNSYKEKILKFYKKLEEIISNEKKQHVKLVYIRDFNACYNLVLK